MGKNERVRVKDRKKDRKRKRVSEGNKERERDGVMETGEKARDK